MRAEGEGEKDEGLNFAAVCLTQPVLVWGAGKGPSCRHTHMVIHCSPHPFVNSVYVCVCECSHMHTSLLTHSAWGWQYLWQENHLVFEPGEGCAYLFL